MMMMWILAVATIAQGWILLGPASLEVAVPVALGVALLWRIRAFLPAHADMLILMAALGGFGMLLPVLYGAPACHLDGHRTAMYLGMILLPAGPCWTQARCVLEARRQGWVHWLLLGDLVGMVAGMEGASLIGRGRPWLHHVLMLVGMLLGMGVNMTIVSLVLTSKRTRADRQSLARVA